MKGLLSVIMTLSVLFLWSCKKDAAPGSIESLFQGLGEAKGFIETKRYYTDGTLGAIERAASQGGVTPDQMSRILPSFTAGARWEELSRDVRGNRADVTIRFVQHPVQNMVGFTVRFRLIREDGGWKIDLKEEVEQSLSTMKKEGAADYLRKLGSFQ